MSWYLTTDQITRVQIEISNYCNAQCPMCDREWYSKSDLNNTLIPIDKIKSIFVNDNWGSLNQVHFCGNYDEPTTHPDLYELCEWILDSMPTRVSISTNGGTRDTEFWTALGHLSKRTFGRLNVVWGIDGLEDTNHLYRKNVVWNKLKQNFECYIQAGGNAIWQFISFEHNYHQYDQIKKLYKEWGFNGFKVINTYRPSSTVPVKDKITKNTVSKPTVVSYDASNLDKRLEKNTEYLKKIECKAINSQSSLGKSLYINHQGLVVPCCWMGAFTELTKTKNNIVEYNKKTHSIYNFDKISDLLKSSFFVELKKGIEKMSVDTCKQYCQIKTQYSSTSSFSQ